MPSERERLLQRLGAAAEERAAALERAQPNLKAIEQFAALQAEEAKSKEALQAAQALARSAGAEFGAVRKRRFDLFTECFEHVSKRVDPLYKALTRKKDHPMGGTASLRTENPDEPFLSGVKLDATPANKRARDTSVLSGGEKSIAALALLFAIQSFRPSPVFILDEVDAAFDPENVEIVARFVRQRADSAESPLQAVVISHKDLFYAHADALLGVCLDQEHAYASQTVAFDLARFQ